MTKATSVNPYNERTKRRAAARRARFARLREKGWTLQRIADRYDITRQAVRKVLLRGGDEARAGRPPG